MGDDASRPHVTSGPRGVVQSPRAMRRHALKVAAGLVLLFALVISLAGPSILRSAGHFLAPKQLEKAQAIVVEGEELLQAGAVAEAVRLMSGQQIRRLILVTHRYSDAQMGFAISENYSRIVSEGLQKEGLKKEQFRIVSIPVAHPITLNEARAVVHILSEESLTSAILIGRGFHTRRSYILYRDLARAKGIRIIPWSSSADYPLARWWRYRDGIFDFMSQCVKLAYYLIRGFIPVGSLFQAA